MHKSKLTSISGYFLVALLTAGSVSVACKSKRAQEQEGTRVLGHVPEFSLVNQNGEPFGTSQLSSKPYLATFMFTRCPSVCPRITARMKEVDAAMKAAGLQLELVSISVDPEYDTPVALSAYQKEQGANVPNWNFLTGDYQSIAKTAEEGFKIGVSGKVEKGKPHLGLTHGSHLVLVNETGDIVGYFPSSEPESVERLVQAVRALKAEQ